MIMPLHFSLGNSECNPVSKKKDFSEEESAIGRVIASGVLRGLGF